jgi:hypothetical protein
LIRFVVVAKCARGALGVTGSAKSKVFLFHSNIEGHSANGAYRRRQQQTPQRHAFY